MSTGTASVTITIASPPATVYELVSDVTRYGEWSPENRGGTWLDGANGPAVGARFKGRNKRKLPWSTTSKVTKSEPGSVFEFETGKEADTRWRYDLRPVEGGSTEVTESVEILREPAAFLKFLTRLAIGVKWDERLADIEAGMRTTLERLRATAERA